MLWLDHRPGRRGHRQPERRGRGRPHCRRRRLRPCGQSEHRRSADPERRDLRTLRPLYGEITIKNGQVEQNNFDSYEVVRLADTPKIEVYLALSGGKKWGGIGEPGTAVTAPAVANAVFAAKGTRVRSMPLKNIKLPGPV